MNGFHCTLFFTYFHGACLTAALVSFSFDELQSSPYIRAKVKFHASFSPSQQVDKTSSRKESCSRLLVQKYRMGKDVEARARGKAQLVFSRPSDERIHFCRFF